MTLNVSPRLILAFSSLLPAIAAAAASVIITAAAAAAATTRTAASAAAVSAATTIFSFVNSQGTTIELGAVHLCDCVVCVVAFVKRNETKPATAASVSIGNNLAVYDFTVLLKCFAETVLIGSPSQATHIKFL